MRQLDRKLLRDLWRLRSQVLAIALVVGCGIAMFVMSLSAQTSLALSRERYYEANRYAQVFAQLKRAPLSLASTIAELPGVATVQTRIVVDVTLDVAGMDEPAVGRLISAPDHGRPVLNDVHLRSGRYLEPGARGEVLVGEAFANAHHLRPGDSLSAVLNGRRQQLKIVGVAISPEYIFQIKPGDLFPDDRRFGVFWMSRTQLAAAWNLEGAFNNVALTWMRGANEKEIIRRLDLLTAPYGGAGAGGRDDQLSHRYLSDEMAQLRVMGTLAPSIFLGVAAFLLNIVATRVISMQREQVAALKAFGFTHREVASHYLKFVLIIAALGILFGVLVGAKLGQGLTAMYAEFYHFPEFYFRLHWPVIFWGMMIGGGAAAIGAWSAVARVARLPAAEAMRSEPPGNFGPTLIERIGLARWLPLTARMIARQLERRPWKSILSMVGIGLAVAVLILGNFAHDALQYLIDVQFFRAQRDDVTVVFSEPTSYRAIHELSRLPGVLRCESLRSAAARIRFGRVSRLTSVQGLPQDRQLRRLLDEQLVEQDLSLEGLVLSTKFAEVLGAGLGDFVTLEILEGNRAVVRVPVVQLINEYAGLNAYMDSRALHRVLREGRVTTGAMLLVDPNLAETLYRQLKNTPRVAGVSVKRAALKSFEETIAENLLRMKTYNIIFAMIIAFGVVYNTARISLSERERELATMRVMGFTRWEVSSILLGELALLTLAALPLGAAMGCGLSLAMSRGLDTELYRIPFVVGRGSMALAFGVTMASALVSGLIVRRRLDQLDLVEALKSRE